MSRQPAAEPARALVVSSNLLDAVSTRVRELIQATVDPLGPATASWDSFERRPGQVNVGLIVVVIPGECVGNQEKGLEIVRLARRNCPGQLLAVGAISDPKFILKVLQQGADTYVDEADLEKELPAGLNRSRATGEKHDGGKIISVLGAAGGSGVSTLAVNIAAALAQDHGKAALIDLKPGRGDLSTLLDLKPAFTLADICLNVSRVDRAIFEKILVPHPTNVHLLAAPQVFEDARIITVQGVNHALALAQKKFPYVVVDQEDCFHEEQLVALRQAHRILLISRLDFTSVRNIRRTLDHLQARDIPRKSIHLVINRHGQPNELLAEEAQVALRGKLAFYVPDDPKTINGANNAGQPAVTKSPHSKVSRTIVQIARELTGFRPSTSKQEKSKLSSFLGLFGLRKGFA